MRQLLTHIWKQHRWRVILGGLGAIALLILITVRPLRTKAVETAKLVLGTNTAPVTIVSDGGESARLREEMLELSTKVAALTEARTADTELIKQLKTEYEAAVKEVAAAHDTFVQEASQLQRQQRTVATANSGTVAPTPTPSAATGKISINTATAAQLDSLPGIGPAYADRIIAYRNEHGPFKSIDDLTNVQGIGPATVDKIRDLVTL